MYWRAMASIITGRAFCTIQTKGCGISRMWLSANPFSLNSLNQWLEMALSAAPLPGTPFKPSTPCQMQSKAEMRSLITMRASGVSAGTS
ncbi:hypothetical protein D3C77_102910 [compost metagenome]